MVAFGSSYHGHAMITKKTVETMQPGSVVWDDGKGAIAGFGARRQIGTAISYVVKYRTADGRQRWQTIGRHGAPWTPDTARAEARRILGDVVKGCDPAGTKQETRRGETVAVLCDHYLADVESGKVLTSRNTTKKASTLATDKGRVERHIKPLLGNLKVRAVTRADIERFKDGVTRGTTKAKIKTKKHGLARVTGGRGAATRTLGLLGAIFAYAVDRGIRTDNPCRGVKRHADGQRDRRMSDDEFEALGAALKAVATNMPAAVAATRFLALTGWRRGEMLSLEWSHIDLATRTARLPDTKTGASMRPLSRAACNLLRSVPHIGPLVFASSSGSEKKMTGFHKSWLALAARAALPADVTPHVLRHSFASVASDLGYTELTIAALLGHRKASMTARYAHHADAVLLQAADKVADHVAMLMGEPMDAGKIVDFPRASTK